jgi:hypothetical protein
MQSDLSQKHITEVIEEAINRRVKRAIDHYVKKNSFAFSEHKIAGIEWNLQLTVLVDNLGLNPKPKTPLAQRILNVVKKFFTRARTLE